MFEFTHDPHTAQGQAAYMRNQFPFCGLKTPERKAQTKPLLAQSRTWDTKQVLAVVAELYARPEREYQYAAIDLARKHVDAFAFEDIQALAHYVTTKPWWDTVDSLRPLFWDYVGLHRDEWPQVWALFYGQDDFWLRRVAITLQLQAKQDIDLPRLIQAIDYDLTTPEFFIQKAIGWALRQQSKNDPGWVESFINSRPLSKLAVKEGSKYL